MAITQLHQQRLQDQTINSSMARQAVINGNFDIYQRGVAATLSDLVTSYVADRWVDFISRDGGTLPTLVRTLNQQTAGDIPNSFVFTRLSPNGAGSSFGNAALHYYWNKIEGATRFLCGNGKKVTLSFWARSSIANKKIGVHIAQNYGTGGSPSSPEGINGNKWTLTSNWTKYTHTFTTNTLAGKTFGTALDDFIQLTFQFMWGSTFAGQVNDTVAESYVGSGNIDIAQVQLCAGSEALPFEPKTYGQELADCRRYCRVFGTGTAGDFVGACYWNTTASALVTVPFDVPMRKEPILESATNTWESHTGVAATFIGVNSTYSSIYACVLDFQGMTGGAAAGDSVAVRAKDTTAKIVISADI